MSDTQNDLSLTSYGLLGLFVLIQTQFGLVSALVVCAGLTACWVGASLLAAFVLERPRAGGTPRPTQMGGARSRSLN